MTQQISNEQTEFVNVYLKTLKEKLDNAISDIVILETRSKIMEAKLKAVMEENETLKKSIEKNTVKKSSTKSD